MPDWTKPMQQTFEYYMVDTGTWQNDKKLDKVKSSTIDRDLGSDTLGSATFDIDQELDECYIRTVLVTNQNGVIERTPLGTHIVQTAPESFDGKVKSYSLDGYTPLIEMTEKNPSIGYSLLKGVAGQNEILKTAYMLTKENVRAPVIENSSNKKLTSDFVANTSDSWLVFVKDLLSIDKYRFTVNPIGEIGFTQIKDVKTLSPRWEYTDDNSSILYPDISMSRDIFGIPNVIEVVCPAGGGILKYRAVNNDPNSPISVQARGREILKRVNNLNLPTDDTNAVPTMAMVKEYAEKYLEEVSTVEFSLSYKHAYCPVTIGDCVLLNYKRAGLTDIKALVTSQSINCVPGCPVSETAVFTAKLWGD